MTAPAPVPNPANLRHDARTYLLGLLHMRIVCGAPIDGVSWREAFGQAADYQTVCQARRELADVPDFAANIAARWQG